MTSVLRELPLSYAVLSEGRRCRSASAFHEPNPAGLHLRALSLRCAAEEAVQTVELLVAERDWEPPPPRFALDQIVGLRVAFAGVAVRDQVKQIGGTWSPERRVWQLRYDPVVALGLNRRVVDEPASTNGCPASSGENLRVDARAPSR